METNTAYLLTASVLAAFGYIGYQSATRDIDDDSYLSSRGTQGWLGIGLSLFASGMGVWVLMAPSEAAYFGGFWIVVGYAASSMTPFLLLAFIGPMIRDRLPNGITLADYVRHRLGRPMQVYVGVISILYMFTFLFAEFIAIGKVMGHISGMDPLHPMIMVGIVTAAYTAHGGLPASLATDRTQAGVIAVLVTMVLVVLVGGDLGQMIDDARAYNTYGVGSITYLKAWESGLALVVAVTAAEMFSQGNWQRVYASDNDESLRKGAILAAAMVFAVVFAMGFLGTVAAGQEGIEDASIAFFYLVDESRLVVASVLIVLVVSLVCSSVDTLQNAIVASLSRDISDGRADLPVSRVATIAMIPIAIYLASGPQIRWTHGLDLVLDFDDPWSVFGIFLFADMLAAATVSPVLMTLWRGISSRGALIGCMAGFASVAIYGLMDPPTDAAFYMYIVHPTEGAVPARDGGMTNLYAFLSAIIGSTAATVVGSYALPDE